MSSNHLLPRSVVAALTGFALMLSDDSLRAAAPAGQTDAFPVWESYIKVSGYGASISGDKAAFQYITRQPKNGGAGIEDLHLARDVSKDLSLVFDGRALAGSEDYLAKLELTKKDFGTFSTGYKRVRTFYDGIGGFFPVNRSWRALNPEDLHLDRGSFWAELKLAIPQAPELTLRYTNDTRMGQKDTTIWGDTDFTGQDYRTLAGGLSGTNNNATVRKLTPSYLNLNEHHQKLEATARQTFGSTTAELSATGDWSAKHNGRFVTRFPGETLPVTPAFAAITPAVGTPAAQWATFQNQVQQSTYDNQVTDTYGLAASTISKLQPKLTFRTGLNYRKVDSRFGGDRILISNTPTGPGFPGGLPVTTTYNVKGLSGDSDLKLLAGKVAVDCTPTKDLTVNFALKGEKREADSAGAYGVVATPNANRDLGGGVRPPTGTTVPINTRVREGSGLNETSYAPVLDLRYKGIRDMSLFASASYHRGHGDENYTPAYNPDVDPRVVIAPSTPANPIYQIISPNTFFNNLKERRGEYSAGTDWHCTPSATLRAEVFLKDNDYHSTGYNTGAQIAGTPATPPTLNNNYELKSRTVGTSLSAIVRPLPTLSLTTRYLYSRGKMKDAGYLPTYPAYDSGDSRNHSINETIDWSPSKQFYAQLNGTLVYNVVITGYPRTGWVAAAGVIPGNMLLQNSNNNYSTLNVVSGVVLTKQDDLQFQATSYRATNGNAKFAIFTVPYGASARERWATVTLKHKFSDEWIGTAKVGYFDSKNDTTGGFTNFRGPLAYIALERSL